MQGLNVNIFSVRSLFIPYLPLHSNFIAPMFRTIFTVFLAYFIYKIARVIIDPMFESPNRVKNTPPQREPKNEAPKAGEYIDYEEVK